MTKLFNLSRRKNTRLADYINGVANASKRPRTYKRKLWNIARKISEYESFRGMEMYTNSMTQNVAEDFLLFLTNQFAYRASTVNSIFSAITTMLHRAHRDGYAVDFSIKDVSTVKEDAFSVYLTPEEVERIYRLSIKNESLTSIKNAFVVGCCTGLRFSDYSRLTNDNIKEGIIRIKTKKTGVTVVIPAHWIILDIIDKYDRFPVVKVSLQNFNARIKSICKKAGLNAIYTVERTEGTIVVKRKLKKYQLISSHTARRSFATNMYLAGVAPAKIMLITGHKTEQSFFKYIKINKVENAKDLATHPFFVK